MSIDKNNRHRGSDEEDPPLLLEEEGAPGEGDVVIGGEESDQAKGNATDGLGQPELVHPEGAETSLGTQKIL